MIYSGQQPFSYTIVKSFIAKAYARRNEQSALHFGKIEKRNLQLIYCPLQRLSIGGIRLGINYSVLNEMKQDE